MLQRLEDSNVKKQAKKIDTFDDLPEDDFDADDFFGISEDKINT